MKFDLGDDFTKLMIAVIGLVGTTITGLFMLIATGTIGGGGDSATPVPVATNTPIVAAPTEVIENTRIDGVWFYDAGSFEFTYIDTDENGIDYYAISEYDTEGVLIREGSGDVELNEGLFLSEGLDLYFKVLPGSLLGDLAAPNGDIISNIELYRTRP